MYRNIFKPPLFSAEASIAEQLDEQALTLREREQLTANRAGGSPSSENRRNAVLIGRVAAHRALAAAGYRGDPSVLRGKRREPVWPDGIVGSLSHSHGRAVALVAHSNRFGAVGFDLQTVRSLPIDIAPRISRPAELDWCRSAPIGSELGDVAATWRTLALFSAKETIYKAIAPRVGRFFGFHSAELTWLSADHPASTELCAYLDEMPFGMFSAVITEELGAGVAPGFSLVIAVHTIGETVMTWTALSRDCFR